MVRVGRKLIRIMQRLRKSPRILRNLTINTKFEETNQLDLRSNIQEKITHNYYFHHFVDSKNWLFIDSEVKDSINVIWNEKIVSIVVQDQLICCILSTGFYIKDRFTQILRLYGWLNSNPSNSNNKDSRKNNRCHLCALNDERRTSHWEFTIVWNESLHLIAAIKFKFN